jgi:predicted dehydrogenase
MGPRGRRAVGRRGAGGVECRRAAHRPGTRLHAPVATAFLDAGIHVICDKPLALDLAEARALQALARRTDRVFAVTYNYSGYPMVRHARQLVRDGALGALRLVQVEYTQDWLSRPLEAEGHKQAAWRNDPARAGGAGCLGDIGTHAYQLACFVTGLTATGVCAELTRFVPGRVLDDNVHAMLRFGDDVRGALWASQVASGAVNGLRLRVHGTEAGLTWHQQQPEVLQFTPSGGATQQLLRARTAEAPAFPTRLPSGHPEGFIEAFATLYRDAALHIRAREAGRAVEPAARHLPTVDDGVSGLAFVEAVLQSDRGGGTWVTPSGS